MKGNVKKMLVFALAATVACGIFTGCGEKNDPNTLNIKVYEAGYGTDCVYAVAERFEELNPGITVNVDPNSDGAILRTEMPSGPSINFTDLYMAGGVFFDLYGLGQFTVDGVTYPNQFADLSDVYENPAYNETKPIKDKMFGEYYEYFHEYNMAPWMAGAQGIVYNSKMFDTYDWNDGRIPVTTDELLATCQEIIETKAYSTNKNSEGEEITISPFTFSKEDQYWEAVYLEWWAQYDGLESYKLFYEGKNAEGKYNANCADTDGQYETMKVLDAILGTYTQEGETKTPRTNIYCDTKLSAKTYIDVQSAFLNAEGARKNETGATTAAMLPMGDWLENEMWKNYSEQLESGEIEFKLMKTPIISAIRKQTPSIKDDATLAEVVRYIDGGETGTAPAGVDPDDIAIIREARGLSSAPGVGHVMMIPVYSSKIELAKDFIRFLYSDEGIALFSEAGHGINLPLEYDYSNADWVSTFQMSKFEVVDQTQHYVIRYNNAPMSYRAGLKPLMNVLQYASFVSYMNAESAQDYMSADTLYQLNVTEVSRIWDRLMDDAGLND